MIVLNLACSSGHRFEGWFASLEAFEEQLKASLVSCPHCGDTSLQRLPAAPYLAGKANAQAASEPPAAERVAAVLRSLVAESEDVGQEFPAEARRIHYEEAPARNIRGLASPQETLELLEEGISVLPLPLPPKDRTH